MKKLLFIFISINFIISIGCKSNNKTEVKAAVTAGTSSDQKSTHQPKDGFAPLPYGVSADPNKEAKLLAALGEGYKKVGAVIMTKELQDNWYELANNLIQSRFSEDKGKSSPSIAVDMWVIDAMWKDTFATKEMIEGRWIDFDDNQTYTYGKFDKQMGKGKFHFSSENTTFILNDDDKEVKPLEFEAEFQGGYIVMFGTKSFDDESINIKLTRAKLKPVKM